MLSIGEIEDLLIARIRERLPYLAEVQPYQDQIDWQDEVPQIALRLPGVLVMLGGRKNEGGTYEDEEIGHTFRLGVICSNLRGDNSGSRDADTGAYRILEDLRQALSRHALHEELQPLAWVKEDLEWASREFVMYAAEYSLLYEVDI